MSKHAPGPWYVKLDEPMRDNTLPVTSGENVTGDWIASVKPVLDDDDGWDYAEMVANARLIASAPDLYAALGRIDALAAEWDANRMGSVDLQRKRWKRLAEIARAALAKARGEE